MVDLIKAFESYGAAMDVYDPWADAAEAKAENGLTLLPAAPTPGTYDAVVLAVAHHEFKAASSQRVCAWARDGLINQAQASPALFVRRSQG